MCIVLASPSLTFEQAKSISHVIVKLWFWVLVPTYGVKCWVVYVALTTNDSGFLVV